MQTTRRWTIADLEELPDPIDDTRYEIIDGDLFVAHQPSLEHQYTAMRLSTALDVWSEKARLGMTLPAPGVIFADDDNVAPDVVWISYARLRQAAGADGKLHAAPELMIEVLSPGPDNVRRDREAKLNLYARRGVDEYWLVDPLQKLVEQYRQEGAGLHLVCTLGVKDRLESPLLPEFAHSVSSIFFPETF